MFLQFLLLGMILMLLLPHVVLSKDMIEAKISALCVAAGRLERAISLLINTAS
jgi:hypothetical protein